MTLRIATFNLENLGDDPAVQPPLADRIRIMRPQLERVRADILCLQEVDSQGPVTARTLVGPRSTAGRHRVRHLPIERRPSPLRGTLFEKRNLVTLSRFPISATRIARDSEGPRPSYQFATASPPDTTAQPLEWERPLLQTTIDLGIGRPLTVINLHLKSKLASTVAGQKIDNYTWKSVSAWAEGSFVSAMKRLGQALQVRLIIDERFETAGLDSLIAVAGDYNAKSDEVSVMAIRGPVEETGNPLHGPRVMVPCENNIPESARYSLFHLGRGEMIDHILVSRPMLAFFQHAEIHNEALPDESGAFRVDTQFPESDHAPLVAEFSAV